MWMVGYNEGGELNMGGGGADYAFSGRKLRPLMPRPSAACALLPSPNNHSSSSSSSPAFTRRIHAHDFLSQYHNLGASSVGLGDQQGGKRELMMNSPAAVVVSSSRWNPTPEQLRALEDLYRRGTRTPSADQIQQITAQLRRYGKIEGKNVFYWFQNHKARERQKRRRQMESAAAAEDPESLQKKDLGASRTVFEVEHTNNWPPSTNCTATLSPEESVSMQRAAECRTDGWVQFDEPELQQRRSFMERNATWHAMQLSCPLPLAAAAAPVSPHLINTPPNANRASSTSSPAPSCRSSYSSMDPKLFKTQHHHLTFFLSPHHAPTDNASVIHSQDDHNNCVQSQTLQLFPTSNMNNIADNSDPCDDNTLANQHQKQTSDLLSLQELNAPTQFFEFLPLKNSR